ncbi:MAG: enoyl-CoA hydratase [Ignavibacteriae bacterium]|nr:enoyl-CoA hydratase [Ignavibacteriota bacterium]
MKFNNLIFETNEKITTVTINRPEKLNALNDETFNELFELFSYLKSSSDTNVIIVTGAGEKAFVAGADIGELNVCNSLTGRKFSKKGQIVFNLIENLGKPVIAAVNGFALGGGCELALACHIRVASENAKFGLPEVSLGIIPGYGGTQRLARIINSGRAAEMILTGDMINAEEAYRIGLANHVYPVDKLLSEAQKIANKILLKGQIAVSLALNAVVSTDNISEAEGIELESNLFGVCCGSEDFKEGTLAFLEKRKPNFNNK